MEKTAHARGTVALRLIAATVFSMTLAAGAAQVAFAEETDVSGDTATADQETYVEPDTKAANGGDWQRIGREGYARSAEVRIGGWNYYCESKNGYFTAYRENDSGKTKKLVKCYRAVDPVSEMVTNGKQVVYVEIPKKGYGDRVYRYDIATGKKTKIADLNKFHKKGLHCFVGNYHVQGSYFYFDRYLADDTRYKNIYRVNIKTGKMSVWKKGYFLGGNAADVKSGKSMLVFDKKGTTYLLSIKGKKVRKVTSKDIDNCCWDGNKMMYSVLSGKTARIYRCNWDGKSNKLLYKFKLKHGATADAGSFVLYPTHIVLSGNGAKVAKYYFKTKKWNTKETFRNYIYPY